MRRLTNMQIDHLTSRIETVINELSRKEIAKLGQAPKLITYTDSEKLALIRSGKAKLKPDATNESKYHSCLADSFVFPETAAMRKAKDARERYDEKVKAINAKAYEDKQRLRDEAILGDSTEAMQMLQALERKLVKA